MPRIVTAIALFCAAMLVASTLPAEEPKKETPKKAEKQPDEKSVRKDIAKLMKQTHRGEKSPHVRIEAELKKETPDWDQVAKEAKAFDEMGKAFKNLGIYYPYTSPKNYITHAAALSKAAGDKDKKSATEAFTALNKSCVSCHSYGGPGGILKPVK
ncbi:MAG: cytochrome c [Planctomycetia bacterium]|nr:cytochrome c [Planctomycetia bacterium]